MRDRGRRDGRVHHRRSKSVGVCTLFIGVTLSPESYTCTATLLLVGSLGLISLIANLLVMSRTGLDVVLGDYIYG